jgi:hypothetical protein
MTGSIAIDVVISLIFIYLLYSLLASLIAEIIATNLGLRARNLHSALRRMLTNKNVTALQTLVKDPVDSVVSKFYNHPEIKSLTPGTFFSKPSFINPETFSKVLVDICKQNPDDSKNLKDGIRGLGLDASTERYLIEEVEEASQDMIKLRASIASWFDNTMKNSTEWYKRNLQILLFFIGFLIAWFFNVNTFKIVNNLSTDKDARDQMVLLASSYLESSAGTITIRKIDSLNRVNIEEDTAYHQKIDALLKLNEELINDISKTQNVLGGGTWLPDSLTISIKKKNVIPDYIEKNILPKGDRHTIEGTQYATFGRFDKLGYAFSMLWLNFFGYAVTALAISLGAPFWFDLLNKFMKLRGAISGKTNPTESKMPPVG